MSQLQLPFSRPAEYFTNGGRGYNDPYTFTFLIRNGKLKVNCYFNELKVEQLEEFKNALEKFFKKTSSADVKFKNSKIYNFYIFEDLEEYRHVGSPIDWVGGPGYRYYMTKEIIKPDPLERYLTNGNQGYEKYHGVFLSEYNIKIKCYYNTVSEDQLKEITNNILAVFKDFFKEFPSAKNASKKLKTFKMNIFNNIADYNYLGGKIPNLKLSGTLGISAYLGTEEIQSELYISDPSKLRTLKHELAHALTYYAVDGCPSDTPLFIMEGIAKYFERNSNVVNLTPKEISEFSYQKLKKLSYAEDKKQGNLLYRAGHAAVSYLQAKHPGIIEQYFIHLRNAIRSNNKREAGQAIAPLRLALSQPETIKAWLYQHNRKDPLSTQRPQKSPLSTQLSQKNPLSTQLPQGKPLSTQPSRYLNKLIELMFAWHKPPHTSSSPVIQQDSKIPIVFSVPHKVVTARSGGEIGGQPTQGVFTLRHWPFF